MTTTIRLDTAQLDKIAAGLDKNMEQILTAFAFEVEAQAKILAPYETGALKGSIYTNAKAGSSTPDKFEGNEYEELPSPTGKVIANVGSGIEYAAFQELGTSHNAAQPFLGPAVEDRAHDLNDGSTWEKLFK